MRSTLASSQPHGAARPNAVELRASAAGALDHDDVGGLVHLFENRFATIGGNVEVAHVELATEACELALRPRDQVDRPQILVSDLPAQGDDLTAAPQEGQMPLAAAQ